MTLELLAHLTENWPTVGLVATLLIGVYLLARYWATAEMRDMRRRIDYLDDQVKALRYRDQAYFEYVLYIEDYQRKVELVAVQHGIPLPKRIPFLEFRDKWMEDKGLLEQKDQIWQT